MSFAIGPINPTVPYFEGPPFPLTNAPAGPDWELLAKAFYPGWASLPDGTYDFLEHQWLTLQRGDINIDNLFPVIQDQFNQVGEGYPLAYRVWHREVIDASIPDHYCLPDFIPMFGGCHDIPFVGGTNIASMHEWKIELIYHNIIPVAIALAIAIAIVIGTLVIADKITHGKVDVSQIIKDAFRDWSPGGTAAGVSQVFLVAAIAFGVIAFVLPTIAPTTSTTIKAGPVSTTMGLGRPAPQPARRR